MKLALVSVGSGWSFGPPLGLLFLAAWARARCPGWDVRVVDGNWEEPAFRLLGEEWDVVGLSAMTCQWEATVRLAKVLKAARQNMPVVVGGVHPSTWDGPLDPVFDGAVRGEGEGALADLLQGGRAWQARQPSMSLSSYPDLDYGLLDGRYFAARPARVWQATVREAPLITSRGCPYRCVFCSTSAFWGRVRSHEPEWVVRQLGLLAERGVTHVQVVDDLFAADKKRLRRIAELFESAGLRKRIAGIGCQSRANVVDAELCDLLRSMNVRIVGFGFESGSDRVLKSLKGEGASVAKNRAAVAECRRAGLRPIGSVMLGSPGETLRDMLRTAAELLRLWRLGLEDAWMFVATPYPGTKFWEEAVRRGTVRGVSDDWNALRLASKWPGRARVSDAPRWAFLAAWCAAQAALLPMKAAKAVRLLRAWFTR